MTSLDRHDSHGSNGPWGNLDHLYGTLKKGDSPGEYEAEDAGSDDETEARGNAGKDGKGGGDDGGEGGHLGGSSKSLDRDGDKKKPILERLRSLKKGSSRDSLSAFSAVPGADQAEHDDVYGSALNLGDSAPRGLGQPSSNPLQCLKSIKFAQSRPTIRAILMTIALLLSSSATLGCRFITVDIGFEPSNFRFNNSVIELGIWSFPPSTIGDGGGRCLAYPSGFTDAYISGDNNWKLARGAGVVGIVLGWVAFMISWLLVINSLKPTLRYKIALAFISAFLLLFESLKFIFLQISLCNAEVWERTYDTGVVELKFAQSCKLSKNGNISVVATLFYLVLCVLLCRSRMREEMETTVKVAGRRAYRMRHSYGHRRRSSVNDADDDSELESLGIGEEEKEADRALDEALAFLESKRFNYTDDSVGETGSADGMEGKSYELSSGGGSRSRKYRGNEGIGGLQGIEEGGSEEEEMEEIPIHNDGSQASQSNEVPMMNNEKRDSYRSRSDSNASQQSTFSAMSDFY